MVQVEGEYITKTDLKKRGWTDSMIKKLNVKPDKTEPNPYYRNAADIKYFSKEKIKQLEKTEDYKDLFEENFCSFNPESKTLNVEKVKVEGNYV